MSNRTWRAVCVYYNRQEGCNKSRRALCLAAIKEQAKRIYGRERM